MNKKIILMILLIFSLFMFGCSANNKLTKKIVNIIETSRFTTIKSNEYGRIVKRFEEGRYIFEEIKSTQEHYIRVYIVDSYGERYNSIIMLYEDGESSKYNGWTSNASNEDKKNIKNILAIN